MPTTVSDEEAVWKVIALIGVPDPDPLRELGLLLTAGLGGV